MIDEPLPQAWLTLHSDWGEVLARLVSIAGDLGLSPRRDGSFGDPLAIFSAPTDPNYDVTLSLQFRRSPKERLIVEAHGDWKEGLHYESYATSLRKGMTPLLREYNKLHSPPLRLSIQRKSTLEPRLPKAVASSYHCFVTNANKNVLHPLDTDRFYAFIRDCHGRKVKLTERHVTRLLLREGFDSEMAEDLGSLYRHGRRILGSRRYLLGLPDPWSRLAHVVEAGEQ